MYCSECGATVSESAKYCEKCGTRLGASIPLQNDTLEELVASAQPTARQTEEVGRPPENGARSQSAGGARQTGNLRGKPDREAESGASKSEDLPLAGRLAILAVVTIAFQLPPLRPFAIGAFVGTLIGLYPATYAENRGQKMFGRIALFACFTLGAIGGAVLAAPAAGVAVLIAKRRAKSGSSTLEPPQTTSP